MSIQRRLNIGASRDTGYPIYQQFSQCTAYECPQPIFHNSPSLFDRMLPDRFSLVPKRRGYVTHLGFYERAYFDCAAEGWEEFLWHERPYGFHIRGSHKLKGNLDASIKQITDVLENFANR